MDLFWPVGREANTCCPSPSTALTVPGLATLSSEALRYFSPRECPKEKPFAAQISMLPCPQPAWEHRNRFMIVRALMPNGLGIPEVALMPSSASFFSTFPNSRQRLHKEHPAVVFCMLQCQKISAGALFFFFYKIFFFYKTAH